MGRTFVADTVDSHALRQSKLAETVPTEQKDHRSCILNLGVGGDIVTKRCKRDSAAISIWADPADNILR